MPPKKNLSKKQTGILSFQGFSRIVNGQTDVNINPAKSGLSCRVCNEVFGNAGALVVHNRMKHEQVGGQNSADSLTATTATTITTPDTDPADTEEVVPDLIPIEDVDSRGEKRKVETVTLPNKKITLRLQDLSGDSKSYTKL